MVSLQKLEEHYRTLMAQMEQSGAAVERQDLDRVEACVQGADRAMTELAHASTQLEGLAVVPGEESAWEGLAGAMRQALACAEQNHAQIQGWINQTQEALTHMGRGGRAMKGYAASGTPDGAEFLSARG